MRSLALEQVDGLGEVGDAEVFGEGGVLALYGEVHFPGDAAVGEVSGGAGAELRDVLGFGEVHFEEGADAGGEGQEVEGVLGSLRRGAGGDGAGGGEGGVDGGLVGGEDAGFGEAGGVAGLRGFVAVEGGEVLDDLGAAAVAVHVAEAANIHEDVEAEALAGVEGAEGFVVAAAVAEAEVNDFRDLGGGQGSDDVADLAVAVVVGGVEEGGCKLDFEGLGALDEIDDGGWGDGVGSEKLLGGLGELGAGGGLVGVGLGVFDQGGSGVDRAGEELGGLQPKFGAEGGDFGLEGRELVGVEVPGGAGGGIAEADAEVADFSDGRGEEAGDLGFKGAGVDDLAEGGVGGEGKEVAGDVKGACLEGALPGLGLHFGGAGDALLEGLKDGGAGAGIGGEEVVDGGFVEGFRG